MCHAPSKHEAIRLVPDMDSGLEGVVCNLKSSSTGLSVAINVNLAE